jgi:hypothetical protein
LEINVDGEIYGSGGFSSEPEPKLSMFEKGLGLVFGLAMLVGCILFLMYRRFPRKKFFPNFFKERLFPTKNSSQTTVVLVESSLSSRTIDTIDRPGLSVFYSQHGRQASRTVDNNNNQGSVSVGSSQASRDDMSEPSLYRYIDTLYDNHVVSSLLTLIGHSEDSHEENMRGEGINSLYARQDDDVDSQDEASSTQDDSSVDSRWSRLRRKILELPDSASQEGELL